MSFALHNAAREGDDVALKALVAQGSSLSVRDKHSRTPLHLSAWAGHLECCKLLVEHGADKSSAAMDDTTALHFAAQKGHLEVVRFLLNEGMGWYLCNVIYQFVLQLNATLKFCKSTPNAGASVNGKTRKGMTPLMFGAQSGKSCNNPPSLHVQGMCIASGMVHTPIPHNSILCCCHMQHLMCSIKTSPWYIHCALVMIAAATSIPTIMLKIVGCR